MKYFIFLLASCLLCINAFAQSEPTLEYPKNVAHGSLGTALVFNSFQLSYDRLLKQKNSTFFKAYYLTLKAGGHITVNFSPARSGTGYLTSIGATALTGKGRNHFEIGLGLGYFIDTIATFDDDVPIADYDESTFYPTISIGYRKQTSKGIMFRTGVGIVEWAYFGFGYSF